MTITEEIDRKSQRPHRSKNITDALKYAYELNGEKSPINIADAIHKSVTVEPVTKYTITWMDGETTLGTDEVAEGTVPSYTGTAPTKEGYTFEGWNSDSSALIALAELPAAEADATYYAIFTVANQEQ